MQETNLPQSTFPTNCSYELAQILAEGFYPEELSDLIEGAGDFWKRINFLMLISEYVDRRAGFTYLTLCQQTI